MRIPGSMRNLCVCSCNPQMQNFKKKRSISCGTPGNNFFALCLFSFMQFEMQNDVQIKGFDSDIYFVISRSLGFIKK